MELGYLPNFGEAPVKVTRGGPVTMVVQRLAAHDALREQRLAYFRRPSSGLTRPERVPNGRLDPLPGIVLSKITGDGMRHSTDSNRPIPKWLA